MRRFIIALVSLVLGSSVFVQAQSWSVGAGYSSNDFVLVESSVLVDNVAFTLRGGFNTLSGIEGIDVTGMVAESTYLQHDPVFVSDVSAVVSAGVGVRLWKGLTLSSYIEGGTWRDVYNCYYLCHIKALSRLYHIEFDREFRLGYAVSLDYWYKGVRLSLGYSDTFKYNFTLSLPIINR